MDLRPLTRIDIPQWADLLACCFNQSSTHMQHLISWLYCLGDLEAYGIWDNNKLIAQYTCLHRTILVNSQIVPVGMSMNMAVHPDYRGQGLIKHVSQPVYETLCNKDVMLGIGFSNAHGVKVDKHSKGYGYQVIGKMHSIITPTREFKRPSLKLSDTICEKQVILADLTTQLNQFYK